MARTQTQKQKPSTEKIVAGIATALIFGVPMVIGFGHLLDDAVYAIQDNIPIIISKTMLWMSIILCGYCLMRTILGITCNIFLPKIPMPRNQIAKYAILAALSVVICVFGSVGILFVWLFTSLLALVTFSFV